MNKYYRVDAIEAIRRKVLLELDPKLQKVKLVDLLDDARTINQLNNEKIFTVSELAKIDRFLMSRISDRTIEIVTKTLDDLQESESSVLAPENITLEYMLDSLKENQNKTLVECYGLLHEKYSLQDIGEDLGVTRERARQIRNAGLLKLRKSFDPLLSEQVIIVLKYAGDITCIKDVPDVTNTYKNTGVIELLIDAFPSLEIQIHSNKYLECNVLIKKDKCRQFDELINEIIDTLQYQNGFVPIADVAENFDISANIITSLKDSVVKEGHIALETNHNIFQRVFDIVVDTLRKEGKPMTTREISKKSGLRWGQVRGVVMRKEKHVFANVGKSTYALTEWGYSELPTDELAYQYIKDSGEPRLAKEIIKHVGLHKKIEDGSILASVSLDKRIVPIAPGVYSLKEWGDENYYNHRSFEVKCADGIIDVLSESGRPMTIKEVLDEFNSKYGDKITDSYTTVNSTMNKLISANKVESLAHSSRNVRYKIAN